MRERYLHDEHGEDAGIALFQDGCFIGSLRKDGLQVINVFDMDAHHCEILVQGIGGHKRQVVLTAPN